MAKIMINKLTLFLNGNKVSVIPLAS